MLSLPYIVCPEFDLDGAWSTAMEYDSAEQAGHRIIDFSGDGAYLCVCGISFHVDDADHVEFTISRNDCGGKMVDEETWDRHALASELDVNGRPKIYESEEGKAR